MTPLLTPKIKIWKKCKKTWTYYPSYACVPKWRSYDVWLLRYKGTTDSLLTFFALLNKKSIFKKNEKNAWRYYHFTQVYQKSWSYAMLYCSWGMTRDGLLFFILSYFFCPFTLLPLTVRKIKIKKNVRKKPGHVIILHKCTKNHDRMLYCSWDMAHDGCNCYFLLWTIFCPFTPPNSPKKNFKKMKKTPGDIILHMCKNYVQMM